MLSRRGFLSLQTLTAAYRKLISPSGPQADTGRTAASLDHYFQSPLYSYSFVQDLPWDIVVAEAERRGIPVADRCRGDIVHDLLTAGDSGCGV